LQRGEFNFDSNETSSDDGSLQLESLGCHKASLESHHVWHPTFHILQAHESKSSGTLSPSEDAPKYSGKPWKIVPSPIDDHLGELKSMDHQPSIYLCAKVQS
jgi:hypothetical protein